MFKRFFAVVAALSFSVGAAFAGDITITDSYARANSASAMTGAAYLVIENTSDSDDRLIAVTSSAAARVMLHANEASDDGMMKMVHLHNGVVLPAGGQIEMIRGGELHIMLMGLSEGMEEGASLPMTLTFEKAGDMQVDVPVDMKRAE